MGSTVTLTGYAVLCLAHGFAVAQFTSRELSNEDIQRNLDLVSKGRKGKPVVSASEHIFPELTDEEKWYLPIDPKKQERFNAVGALFTSPLGWTDIKAYDAKTQKAVDSKRWHVKSRLSRCTAFYVSANVLATSAHCFTAATHAGEDTHHVIWFRQQFVGSAEKYSDAEANDFERVIVEWAYPTAFDELEYGPCADQQPCKQGYKCADNTWCPRNMEVARRRKAHDYAFLRTDRPSHNGAHYTIASANNFLQTATQTSLLTVGYPGDFSKFAKPVAVRCQLASGDDELVKKDLGMQRYAKMSEQRDLLELTKGVQLFCIGTKGKMASGGSGGPWLLDESAIDSKATIEEKQELLRTVVGITSWSPARMPLAGKPGAPDYKKLFMAEQSFSKAALTPWITPKVVSLANAAANVKKDQSLEQALKSAP